jgi:hypothetical protein
MLRAVALSATLALAACATPPPPAPPLAPPPTPVTAYTTAAVPGSYGGAAWRPAADEQVLALGGQRCVYRDLVLCCLPPTPPPTPPTAKPTGATPAWSWHMATPKVSVKPTNIFAVDHCACLESSSDRRR